MSDSRQSSEFENRIPDAFIYQFKNCKFDGISYSNEIGGKKVAKINFTIEVDPENYNKGVLFSGVLGIEKIEDFILIESGNLPALPGANVTDGSYILQEDDDLLVSNLQVLY